MWRCDADAVQREECAKQDAILRTAAAASVGRPAAQHAPESTWCKPIHDNDDPAHVGTGGGYGKLAGANIQFKIMFYFTLG